MVTEAAPKTTIDVVRELAALLMKHRIESPEVQGKIDELVAVARNDSQSPPGEVADDEDDNQMSSYEVGLRAAQDALSQVFGLLLDNLPHHERSTLSERFVRAFDQEFMRLDPQCKTRTGHAA